MKKIILILTVAVSSSASAVPKEIVCTGKSEAENISIENLVVTKQKIAINYTRDEKKYFKGYRTRIFLRRNGSTDTREAAHYIEGFNDSETAVLPQYGKYKEGLESQVVFDHMGQKIVGVVSCTQK